MSVPVRVNNHVVQILHSIFFSFSFSFLELEWNATRKKEIRVELAKDGTELSCSGGQRILDPREKDCSGFVTGAVH